MSNLEINWTVEETVYLSPEQLDICQMKANAKTINDIYLKYHVNEQAQLSAICHTIRGIKWSPHVETGGNFPYMTPMDTHLFKKEIEDNCLDMDCLRTIDGLELAFQLKQKRFYRGLKIAHWCCQHYKLNKKVQDTLNSICPNSIPSFQWLNGFCEANQIKIKTGERLEDARRRFCNIIAVTKFFTMHGPKICQIDKRLLWNIDETSSACTKRFKVLINEGCHFAPSVIEKDYNHITAILPFNASGDRLEPFVILPNTNFLPPELDEFEAFLCTQKSGWMNKRIFLIFCIWLTSKLNNYRANHLPSQMFDNEIIILMDNHPSRINPLALRFLQKHNISVITFPAHCTHLLQPFDVAVARSFKSLMQSIQFTKKANDKIKAFPTKAAQARFKILYLITSAWRSVSKDTLIEGFKKPGLANPYDPSKSYTNDLCNKTILPVDNRRRQVNQFGCQCITSNDIIIQMYNKIEKTHFNNINQLPPFHYTDSIFTNISKFDKEGFALMDLPPLFVKIGPNNYSRVLY